MISQKPNSGENSLQPNIPNDYKEYQISHDEEMIGDSKWINNKGENVEEVFGFNENAELVNGRAAMFGFLMLIVTEIVYKGEAVTKSIFGIGL
tara:strand:- start:687 stop:965 length:279 start_codon:yes stop_codon:yes gene_type:complete